MVKGLALINEQQPGGTTHYSSYQQCRVYDTECNLSLKDNFTSRAKIRPHFTLAYFLPKMKRWQDFECKLVSQLRSREVFCLKVCMKRAGVCQLYDSTNLNFLLFKQTDYFNMKHRASHIYTCKTAVHIGIHLFPHPHHTFPLMLKTSSTFCHWCQLEFPSRNTPCYTDIVIIPLLSAIGRSEGVYSKIMLTGLLSCKCFVRHRETFLDIKETYNIFWIERYFVYKKTPQTIYLI